MRDIRIVTTLAVSMDLLHLALGYTVRTSPVSGTNLALVYHLLDSTLINIVSMLYVGLDSTSSSSWYGVVFSSWLGRASCLSLLG